MQFKIVLRPVHFSQQEQQAAHLRVSGPCTRSEELIAMNRIRYIWAAAAASIALCFSWIVFAAEKSGENPPVMFVQTAGVASYKDGRLTLMSPSTTFLFAKTTGHMP